MSINQLNKNRNILLAALGFSLLMVLYAQFILGYFSKCYVTESGPDSLGLLFGYGSEDVAAFLKFRSEKQLQCYIRFLRVWDMIFPVIYTLMYVFWFRYFFKSWMLLSILPMLHMIADWAENYTEILMVNSYLNSAMIIQKLVNGGSALTTVKWVLSFITYGFIVYGIVMKIRQKYLQKRMAYNR